MSDKVVVLEQPVWQARERAHQARVDGWLAGHRARARRGESHPVEDFLFTYYSFRPAQLRRWHPGVGVVLAGPQARRFLDRRGYRETRAGVEVDAAGLPASRRDAVSSVARLLAATAARPASFGCFGMHEWAMVHGQRPDAVRHAGWPLRATPGAVDALVREVGLRCTHFDAYRFFTASAVPLNARPLTRAGAEEQEQPGCLHAGMDLYKWAYKLVPLVASELVADCFALARELRTLDMRASPYDLTGLGYPPVRVETAEGRAEYVAAQRALAARAAPLRARLIEACALVLESPPHSVGVSGNRR